MANNGEQDDQQHAGREKVRAIDPGQLSKHFESEAVEKRWIAEWERRGIYHWDPDRPRDEVMETVRMEVSEIEGLTEEEQELVFEERFTTVWEQITSKWIEYGEYIRLEFDTEAGTAKVLENK